MPRRGLAPVLIALAALLTGCGGSHSTATIPPTATAATPPAQAHSTVWLCFPGKLPDPCGGNTTTTVVRADGTTSVQVTKAAAHPPIDCFYVYPTVSLENTGNADLKVQLPELLTAFAQASRFSQVCRVYAPVYRQVTSRGLTTPSLHPSALKAYGDVLAAWKDYLAHYNHGRGVVLIGHSQGAYALKQLVKAELDRSPAQRRLLVSAILLGGQVLVGNTPADQGDFPHIPLCASMTQTRCVIAYSSFAHIPPPNAMFGRDPSTSTHVACVNPAAPGGGAAPVTPLFPAGISQLMGGQLPVNVKTPWVSFPGLYTARCERSGTASWLQINHERIPGDKRPIVRPLFGNGWGLHGTDVNIALADLVGLVGREARAYTGHH